MSPDSDKAVILVVDDDLNELDRIAQELFSRYAGHYEITCESSPEQAKVVLRQMLHDGRHIALALIDQWLPETTGVQFLAEMKHLSPHTKRGLLVQWGAWGHEETAEAIVAAMTLGHIDYYVLKPWRSPDELFHRTITVFLHEWSRTQPLQRPQIAVVGDTRAKRSQEVRELLARFRIDYAFYAADAEEGQRNLDRAGVTADQLPVVIMLNGKVLIDPSNAQLADAFGVRTVLDSHTDFDLAVIGAGPAGLGAAVYGSSEGLRTLAVEREVIGGQAGSSSLIRNYLGFARGVSGTELAQQAFQQAWVFGTTFLMTRAVTGIRSKDDRFVISLSNGQEASSKAVVLAMGVSYRKLEVPGLNEFIGAGVFYGASGVEEQSVQGSSAVVVGGGNSAGQAALHLAAHADQVTIVIRKESLALSMSDYLIKEIDSTPKISVRAMSHVVAVEGEGWLERVTLSKEAETETLDAQAMFIFIGAHPHTEWLPEDIARDRWGFILTGTDVPKGSLEPAYEPLLLETSVPGIFAAGDVRHGSLKRCAAAVAEGSTAIRLVHEHLERRPSEIGSSRA